MENQVTLAITLHDPDGRLLEQLRKTVPFLTAQVHSIVANVSPDLDAAVRDLLLAEGVRVRAHERQSHSGIIQLGQVRRAVLTMALETHAPFILYCDGDRVLHWADRYPNELTTALEQIPAHDFTIFGRTPRAFQTHPQVQRDTERIINQVFAQVSGQAWDITAAARGLSRAAAQAIVDGSHDDSFGVDASWPLFVQRAGRFTMAYVETEGLEFETADRFVAEIQAAGGLARWLAQFDSDPQHWAFRLQLAQIEVESMLPYAQTQ